MSAGVCLALSLKLLHNFTVGPAVVTVFVVNLATFFFPLLKGLIAFPSSLAFLLYPSRAAFKIWGVWVCFTTCHYVTGVSVVVATIACKSLYHLL